MTVMTTFKEIAIISRTEFVLSCKTLVCKQGKCMRAVLSHEGADVRAVALVPMRQHTHFVAGCRPDDREADQHPEVAKCVPAPSC